MAQPTGASVVGDEITWSGTVTGGSAITLIFVVTHTGDYGDVVVSTVEYGHASGSDSDDATFTVESAIESTIFTYLPIIMRNHQ